MFRHRVADYMRAAGNLIEAAGIDAAETVLPLADRQPPPARSAPHPGAGARSC